MNALKLLSRDEMRKINGGDPAYSSCALLCQCDDSSEIHEICNWGNLSGEPRALCEDYCISFAADTAIWGSWGEMDASCCSPH